MQPKAPRDICLKRMWAMVQRRSGLDRTGDRGVEARPRLADLCGRGPGRRPGRGAGGALRGREPAAEVAEVVALAWCPPAGARACSASAPPGGCGRRGTGPPWSRRIRRSSWSRPTSGGCCGSATSPSGRSSRSPPSACGRWSWQSPAGRRQAAQALEAPHPAPPAVPAASTHPSSGTSCALSPPRAWCLPRTAGLIGLRRRTLTAPDLDYGDESGGAA